MGAPDILVNNAGTIHRAAAEDHDLDAWKQVLQVNLTSAFRLCQLAGREMLEAAAGEESSTLPP
jgi:2-deoxy-D-gluconate 3-dehydrogenase